MSFLYYALLNKNKVKKLYEEDKENERKPNTQHESDIEVSPELLPSDSKDDNGSGFNIENATARTPEFDEFNISESGIVKNTSHRDSNDTEGDKQ